MSKTTVATASHCAYSLHAHLVFVTKYRRRVLQDRHLTRAHEIMNEVSVMLNARVIEFNGESNHVHLLIEYPPSLSISRLVNRLKGSSSRQMRKEFPELRHRMPQLWSDSYFAGSVGGAPLEVLRQYIENQDRPL